jgi:5-hydroxyisourate hydrolase
MVVMSAITTHVLNTALGKPASGVSVQLDKILPDGTAQTLSKRVTNADGRVPDLWPTECHV